MSDSNKIVHGLWIGTSLSKLERLTIESFLASGHTFWLWVYEDITTPLPPGVLVKDARTILPAHAIFRYKNGNQFGHGKGSLAGFSDIFRYKLLYEYGGWWSDMDVTCLRPLDFDTPYVFRRHDVLPVVGNVMKCPKGSELMHYCFDRAIKEVTEDNADWLKPIRILNEGIENFQLSSYIKDISNLDRWEIVKFYYTYPMKPGAHFYIFHWMNEEWRVNGLSKEECIRHSYFDSLMTQYGIEIEKKSPPNRWIYFLQWSKMSILPKIPRPIRLAAKYIIWHALFWVRKWNAWILPFFPRSWKDYIKNAFSRGAL